MSDSILLVEINALMPKRVKLAGVRRQGEKVAPAPAVATS
jgi:hypothetical protein